MEPDESTLNRVISDGPRHSITPPVRMSTTESTPAADVFENHRRLLQWVLQEDGYLNPNAQIAFSWKKGYHVIVAGEGVTLAKDTRIASCPMSATLSVLNAFDVHPFSNHGLVFPGKFLRSQAKTPQSLQAFFLMEQLILGETSWWSPFIATLPTVEEVTAMQFEEQTDVLWLEGTNLKGGLSDQAAKWKEMYLQGSGQLRQLGWANALNGSYTWPKFRWAATIFGSRSFTSQVLDATKPSDLARLKYRQKESEPYDLVRLFSDRFGVLLPLLDLLNHRPGAQVEWQARYGYVGLQILEPYTSGHELCNNYGPRDNEGLLLAYGFTIENNPFDHLVISIKAPPGSPLDAARKTWQQDLRSDPERRCFIFDHKHPESTSAIALETSLFSFDLLDSISILCANEREMQSMNSRGQSLMSYCLHKNPKFEDGRIILATLSQLWRECSARMQRLRQTDPARTVPRLVPSNVKQRHAKLYRDGQLEIVETAAAVCNFVLRCAVNEMSDDEHILAISQDKISGVALGNLRTLVSRHKSRLTHPMELLDCDALADMIPSSERLRQCLTQLDQRLNDQPSELRDGPVSSGNAKARLAVCLSALYSEYSHGVKLPHQVTEWIKQLVAWYPLDPSSWAFVPPSGPWAPGEEPPPQLVSLLAARAALLPKMSTDSAFKRWLRPERLCWGWNVMEEEKVTVPTSVMGSNVGSDGNAILIYWQRY